MEITLDQLIKESTSLDEVGIIQTEDLSGKHKRDGGSSENDLKKYLETTIRQEQMNVLENMNEQLNAETEVCTKLLIAERKVSILLRENLSKEKEIEALKIRNETIETRCAKLKMKYKNLKRSIADKPEVQSSAVTVEQRNLSEDQENEVLKCQNEEIKAKYTKLKMKYKNLKRSIADKSEEQSSIETVKCENEMTVIGSSLAVNTYKLSRCRNKDYSKFTRDLLEIVFAPEMLYTGVLKGPDTSSVLNPDLITDIQMYVSQKFNVSAEQVRAAIRSKLNSCHKAYKKLNGVSNPF